MSFVNNIASGIASAKAYLTGSDVAAGKTTIETNPTKLGGTKTTIKTVGAQGTGDIPPPLPPKPNRAAVAASMSSMAPRAALPGAMGAAMPGVGHGHPSVATSVEASAVQEGGIAANTALDANSMMLAQIQETALGQMRFQTQNAQIESIKKASEALSKGIRNIGDGIKSTGAQ